MAYVVCVQTNSIGFYPNMSGVVQADTPLNKCNPLTIKMSTTRITIKSAR